MRATRPILIALLLPLAAALPAETLAAQSSTTGRAYQGPGTVQRRSTVPPKPWAGPGDRVPPPSSGGGGEQPTTSQPAGPPPTSTSTPSVSTTSGTDLVARASHEVGPESWWTWWELHRLDYLRPNLIRNWVATVTAGGEGYPARALERVREVLRPLALRDLGDGDPNVRAGAALLLGRMGGEDAVTALFGALGDGSLFVRERALLALGATGSSRAAIALLEIARTGALPGATERVCPDARMIAILALGVGRLNGFDAGLDHSVARLGLDVERAQRTAVQTALACYQALAPGAALEGWCAERAADEEIADHARCRALEALRFRTDADALEILLEALRGPRLEARRSAALALGELDRPEAVAPLVAATRTEKEPLADSFLLVSIGRQGGDAAKRFLLEALVEGPKTQRAWCALALGILARDDDDPELRATLRARLPLERNHAVRGAWYLALGLARDARALPLLRAAITEGAPESRAAAAFAMAMIGGEEAHTVLRVRLAADPSPFVRAQVAQALGFLGDARDAGALVAALREQPGPEYLSTVALALGLHGSRAALEGLLAVIADDRASPPARAAAYEAVQLLVGKGPSLALADLWRQTNYAVFPPPLVRHLDMPL